MKHAIAILLACCATPAMAEDLPVTLANGATWTLTAEHTRSTEGGNKPQNWSLTTVKRLTWHAGDKRKPDTLTVTPISAVAGAGSPPEVATARSLAIPATLVVDESLVPGEVVNKAEVRAEFARLIPSAATASPELVDASSRAMIASELGTVSRAQGLALKLGELVSVEVEMPNPLGGPPLRGVESALLESFDKPTGRAVVQWRQALDPASVKESTAGMLLSMAKGKVDPAKIEEARAVFATAAIQNETACRHEIDIPSGLTLKAECDTTNTVTLQGKTQRVADRWIISQTLPGTS
jgi:hypothetical protein